MRHLRHVDHERSPADVFSKEDRDCHFVRFVRTRFDEFLEPNSHLFFVRNFHANGILSRNRRDNSYRRDAQCDGDVVSQINNLRNPQTWFQIEKVVKVPPGAFKPPPKVDSVVLRLEPLAQPRLILQDEELFRKVVRGAFAQRRKTLRNSLLGSGWSAELLDQSFSETGIDPRRRGETLKIEEFGALANVLSRYERS